MDYLINYPEKKNRKKYYPLVVCFDRFAAIRHLVFISCLLPLLRCSAGAIVRMMAGMSDGDGEVFLEKKLYCICIFCICR